MLTASHKIHFNQWSRVLSSYFVLSLHFLPFGNCGGCWAKTTSFGILEVDHQKRYIVLLTFPLWISRPA
jgi:hypothetical protein